MRTRAWSLLSVSASWSMAFAQVGSLAGWGYDQLYDVGVSAQALVDGENAHAVDGEVIGEVADLVIGAEGRVVAVEIEIGEWDLGYTHALVPFDEIDATVLGGGIEVPISEETMARYDTYGAEALDLAEVGDEVVIGSSGARLVGGLTRLSDLVGDRVRIMDGDSLAEYGRVDDAILIGDAIAAVVVEPDAAHGTDLRALPHHEAGHATGGAYYDLPHTGAEIAGVAPFDPERLE